MEIGIANDEYCKHDFQKEDHEFEKSLIEMSPMILNDLKVDLEKSRGALRNLLEKVCT